MSAPTGFTLQYGPYNIIVQDVSKTVWFGDYHGGKLAIYVAEYDDPELKDHITMLCVYYDVDEADFILASHYAEDCVLEEIIADLQARVIIKYAQAKAAQAIPSIEVPGPDTLQ